MVEIISLPDSPVILTNRCYEIRTAVTPNRASDTGAVLLRDLKSLCKGPRLRCISETMQDSHNSGPFKSKIVCSLALALIFISLVMLQRPASASTDINADKLAEFFVEKVEGVRAVTSNVPPPSYVRHDASPQLL